MVLWTHLGATFPAGFDRGLTIYLGSYDVELNTTVVLEIEFHENNNILVSHPDKHERDWTIIMQ